MKRFGALQLNAGRILILIMILCLLPLPGKARAEGDALVSFGAAAGASIAHNADLEANPPAGQVVFDPGYTGKIALGVVLSESLHLEAEYLYTYHNIDSILTPPTLTRPVASDRVTHNLMLSAMIRTEVPPLGDENWTRRGFYFYAGAGAGYSLQDYTVETVAGGSDGSLSGQVILGFEKMNPSRYLFAASPSPFLQYRFLHITEGDFGSFRADANMHVLEFGFRFYGGIGN